MKYASLQKEIPCDTDHFWTIWHMQKRSASEWKSQKQFEYFYNRVCQEQKNEEGLYRSWVCKVYEEKGIEQPKADMCIYIEQMVDGIDGKRFGRQYRRWGRVVFLDETGVVRVDVVKYQYDGNGGSAPKEILVG